MKHRPMQMLWRIFLFFVIITAFFSCVIVGTMPKYRAPSTQAELETTDLSRECLCLSSAIAEHYPGKLYTAADFAAGRAVPGDPDAKYETCRIVLSLQPGVTYGITGQTATYAQRVYVDGALLSETGTVSDTPSGFVPQTDLYTVYFTAQQARTELIIQHAWFNHQTGALHKLYIAEQHVIASMERAQTLCDGLIVGTLLSMALFFLGMFLFYSSTRGMLWFSLSCLCAAANYLLYESKQVLVLMPFLSWYAAHKAEHLTNLLYLLCMLLFAFSMLQLRPKRWFRIVSLGLSAALAVYYLIAPSTFYTRYAVPISACMIGYALFAVGVLLTQAVRGHCLRRPEQWIVCLSPLLTVFVYLIEGITYFSHLFYLRSYATILLSFGNALALTLLFSRTEQELAESKLRELEISEHNAMAMLEKMNELKSDFMRNIAHEMKTPLTVMSGYAQLTERQLQKDAVNAETGSNLNTIAREAQRLSDMVTHLLDVTCKETQSYEYSSFLPTALLEDAAAVCRPILAKRGNCLQLSNDVPDPIVSNREALLQVLVNLAINAGKHTKNGWICFRAEQGPGGIRFSVRDDGEGIAAHDLPHIFERGYSTDGGSGLGLPICRDIVESMGGTICVAQTGPEGTTISFTIPHERSQCE